MEYLRGMDSKRRHGVYLAEDESYGTLVTEIYYDDEHASCDFKPKWLLQSPSAPQGAKRCRTCALQAARNPEPHPHAFCPLVLTTGDKRLLEDHLETALVKMRGAPISIPEQVDYAIPFLQKSPMLPRLKELQAKYDPDGPLVADLDSENFGLAMTLRDCNMFMKVECRRACAKLDGTAYTMQIPIRGTGKVEARLGDFDLKSPKNGKADYWKSTEQRLIDEGWYAGTEDSPRPKRKSCLLSTRQ